MAIDEKEKCVQTAHMAKATIVWIGQIKGDCGRECTQHECIDVAVFWIMSLLKD